MLGNTLQPDNVLTNKIRTIYEYKYIQMTYCFLNTKQKNYRNTFSKK